MADNSFLFFNSSINVDSIKIDTNLTDSFQDATYNKDEMLSTTILFNTYDRTIEASYFSPESPVGGASFGVYKKTPDQKYYDFITLLTNGQYQFWDYNVVNGQSYHYLAAVETTTGTGVPEYLMYQNFNEDGSLSYTTVNWDRWSLVNIIQQEDGSYVKDGSIWKFRCNIESEDLTQNTSVTSWDTLGYYPKFSVGQKNYNSSTFTALLGDIEEYTVFDESNPLQPSYKKYGYTEKINKDSPTALATEKLKAWESFCSDGETKLLKDLKGNAWIVQILANPTKKIDLKTSQMYTTISFQWQEVDDITAAQIVKIGDKA